MINYPVMTADEAARLIKNDYVLGIGGFSSVGVPKAVPSALARYAIEEHEAGRPFKVGLITGGATGPAVDTELALAKAVKFRTPFQSNSNMRNAINAGEVEYFDCHLSMIGQDVFYGFLGKMDVAIIEASEITPEGSLILTTSVGIAPSLAAHAEHIIVELNEVHAGKLTGMHDIYLPEMPPYRKPFQLVKVNDRIGTIDLKIDPKKVIAVVHTNSYDKQAGFKPLDNDTRAIGAHISNFLVNELKRGGIPKEFLPLQSGVGNVANAVLGALGDNPEVPPFSMFTEVIQNSAIDLIMKGRCLGATGSSLSLTDDYVDKMYANMDIFGKRIILRPQEITNHPECIRRLGVIALNTALEADIFGNINSTHVLGTKMMNGIGGSGDFTRNAFLSIFSTPSLAKGSAISSIVPMVTHVDSNEHSVRVLVTEQGVADLRGKSPSQRARLIIENCVHPDYKQLLWDYLKLSEGKSLHTPHSLRHAFAMHIAYEETGDMRNAKF